MDSLPERSHCRAIGRYGWILQWFIPQQPHLPAASSPMWRAFFLASGIFACILGAQCLVVDSFVWASEPPPTAENPVTLFGAPPLAIGNHDLQPAEWAPWSLLSGGAVVILYSLTLNRQGP